MKTKKTKTVHFEKSIRRSPVRRGLLLIPVLFGCFALSPTAPAVSPAPAGGYSGNNTAEGTNALFNLNTGTNNTANGFAALYHTTSGINNTANGYQALWYNATGNLNTAIGF